ncbi:MAG: hypothetical protein SGJ23_13490 [Alphaproteobacteria bacterium]|nr:hypothetical protein [Alphaproteobacteria bacterium]
MNRDVIELVRCYPGSLVEEEWVARLLAPMRIVWRDDPAFERVTPGALYLMPGSLGLPDIPERYLREIEAAGDCGLLHFGDEFLRGDYRVYARFAYALRNYHAAWLDGAGVLTFPLGYPPGLSRPTEVIGASQREHLWCFLGARNPARAELVRALRETPRGFVSLPDVRKGESLLSRERYVEVMTHSAFAPAPMGNVVIETWRFWEALEYGAIPVAPRNLGFDYYANLLGPNPIPTFRTWPQAAAFMSALADDPVALDQLQREVLAWWADEKVLWAERVNAHVAEGRAGAHRAALSARFSTFSRRANQPRRMAEFLKHHDAVALGGRFTLAARRMGKRVLGASPAPSAPHPLHDRTG